MRYYWLKKSKTFPLKDYFLNVCKFWGQTLP